MEEVRYMISEAAKRVEVEAHVLRYWQRELDLPISRNEMEQRYYKESDIELLKRVKHLKDQGFQLKAIKMILSNLNSPDSIDSELIMPHKEDEKVIDLYSVDKLSENKERTSLIPEENTHVVQEESNSKMSQFKTIMSDIILSALKENNSLLTDEIGMNVSDGVVREMSFLMRVQEEKQEERFRKFDATLRDYQKSRLMSAATTEHKKRKSKFLQKNRIYI